MNEWTDVPHSLMDAQHLAQEVGEGRIWGVSLCSSITAGQNHQGLKWVFIVGSLALAAG